MSDQAKTTTSSRLQEALSTVAIALTVLNLVAACAFHLSGIDPHNGYVSQVAKMHGAVRGVLLLILEVCLARALTGHSIRVFIADRDPLSVIWWGSLSAFASAFNVSMVLGGPPDDFSASYGIKFLVGYAIALGINLLAAEGGYERDPLREPNKDFHSTKLGDQFSTLLVSVFLFMCLAICLL